MNNDEINIAIQPLSRPARRGLLGLHPDIPLTGKMIRQILRILIRWCLLIAIFTAAMLSYYHAAGTSEIILRCFIIPALVFAGLYMAAPKIHVWIEEKKIINTVYRKEVGRRYTLSCEGISPENIDGFIAWTECDFFIMRNYLIISANGAPWFIWTDLKKLSDNELDALAAWVQSGRKKA